MLEEIREGLEGLGVVMAVDRALVQRDLHVHQLAVDHVSVAVQLVAVALGAEGDEHREGAEVVDVVEHRAQAQRAHVRDDHRTVEGAGFDQRIGDQAEVIHHTQDGDGKAEKKARHPGQGVGHLFGVVVLFAGLDLLDLFVELAVDVEDRVGGLEKNFLFLFLDLQFFILSNMSLYYKIIIQHFLSYLDENPKAFKLFLV